MAPQSKPSSHQKPSMWRHSYSLVAPMKRWTCTDDWRLAKQDNRRSRNPSRKTNHQRHKNINRTRPKIKQNLESLRNHKQQDYQSCNLAYSDSVIRCATERLLCCVTYCTTVKTLMSTTITIRIPRELKERMKQNPAEWSAEVRNFIEQRIRNLELQKALKEIEPRAQKRHVKPDSTTLISEDRERSD